MTYYEVQEKLDGICVWAVRSSFSDREALKTSTRAVEILRKRYPSTIFRVVKFQQEVVA